MKNKNQYYFELNTTVESVLSKDLTNLTENIDSTHISVLDRQDYNKLLKQEFIDKIERISPISIIMIFNKVVNEYGYIHSDVNIEYHDELSLFGLNIVIDPSINRKSIMQWYSLKKGVSEKSVSLTEAKTTFIKYSPAEIVLEDKCAIDKFVTLVRTNVPHQVIAGDKPRMAITIRFSKQWTDWGSVVDEFENAFNQ